MSETAQSKRGGKPFQSILEPHFDFIHQQRLRRKTWQEIADLLFTEKGIRVTFYAPYRFYRRQLRRRAKEHRAIVENNSQVQPTHQNAAAGQSQKRPSPLPPKPDFKQPDLSKCNTDQYT